MEIKATEKNAFLIKKDDVIYLIKKEYITGTLIYNYFIYESKDYNCLGDFSTLDEAIEAIQNGNI